MAINKPTASAGNVRYILIIGLVVAAFFGAYRYAAARNAQPTVGSGGIQQAGLVPAAAPAGGDAGSPACACCGTGAPTANGISGDPVEGEAAVNGAVQAIDVDVSTGIYNPNVIVLKAGIPAEITFSQSSGCTAQVMSKDLGFFEDLSAGPRTVKVPALEAGEYAFSCGMEMVFGKIVVK